MKKYFPNNRLTTVIYVSKKRYMSSSITILNHLGFRDLEFECAAMHILLASWAKPRPFASYSRGEFAVKLSFRT